jgi:MFS family permease
MYVVGFMFSLSAAIPTYINSSYLSSFIDEKLVGIIYAAASIIAIAAFIEMPAIVRRFGTMRCALVLIAVELASVGALSMGIDYLSVIAAFMLNFVAIALLNFVFDVILESSSPNSKTGRIRGAFLTVGNVAWLVSPLIASKLIGDGTNYTSIYAVSGALLIPVTALIFMAFRSFKDPEESRTPFLKSFAEIWADRNIKGVLLLHILLQFFYAWMIIYTPIYLLEVVGFDWSEIGVIFTIMLVPFVLLEAPLGRLADRNGEKLVMGIGFAIMGISTCLIPFITDHNIAIWAAILFMTRVGAAMVEVMTDTYFFKKVDASKTNIISFFRTARPLAYVIGPIAATILFIAVDMRGLFIFLGLLMFYGLRYSMAIEDIK